MVVQRKRAPAERNNYGRGAFTGYTSYRYGTDYKTSRDLAVPIHDINESAKHWNPRKPHKARLPKPARERIVAMLMDMLRDWENSPWEDEAETLYALRAVFLQMGWAWSLSDAEAADLLRLAYSRLGQGIERRPKWEEGQAYVTTSHTLCNWCAGPLDPFAIEIGNRFCCKEHARKAADLRDYEHRFRETEIGKNADAMLRRVDLPIRKECARAGCHEHFRPTETGALYCSEACNHAVKEARKKAKRHEAIAEQPKKLCAHCNEPFAPKTRTARDIDLYCTEKCQKAAAYQRAKARGAIKPRPKLDLPEIHCQFEGCGEMFKPSTRRARFCCREHKQAQYDLERKL